METKIVPEFDLTIDRLGTDAEKFESRERIFGTEDVEPVWVADMDLAAPPFLQEALTKRVSHPCYGYTEQSDSLKGSLKWWMKEEHDLDLEDIDLFFSPSVVTTFNNAISAFSKQRDGVALFSPVYGPFYFAIKNHKRTLIDVPLVVNDELQYDIDFDKFKHLCENGNIKLLLLCNPQNPSGRVWTKDELERLVSICSENGVVIISDEIHSDIIFDEAEHHSILTIDGSESCSIVAHSIGKTFNTSGLQASFAIIKDRKLRKKYNNVAELSHTNDINLLGKTAIETLFSENGKQYKTALLEYLKENRDILVDRLSQIPNVKVMNPQSTFLVWIDFSETGMTHREVMTKLIESQLGLGQGKFFGPTGELWFRWNFAVSRENLLLAIEKVEKGFGF